jgi:hypothetical protein
MSADERDAEKWRLFGFRAMVLLTNLADDEACRLDHHGQCQTHNLETVCSVAAARDLCDQLAKHELYEPKLQGKFPEVEA